MQNIGKIYFWKIILILKDFILFLNTVSLGWWLIKKQYELRWKTHLKESLDVNINWLNNFMKTTLEKFKYDSTKNYMDMNSIQCKENSTMAEWLFKLKRIALLAKCTTLCWNNLCQQVESRSVNKSFRNLCENNLIFIAHLKVITNHLWKERLLLSRCLRMQ